MKKNIKDDELQQPDRGLVTEYVRERLFFVFNVTDDIKRDKKIVLRHVDVSNPANFRRPSTVIEIDGKKIRVPAQTIHATEVKKYKSSSALISEINFHHLRWSRAVKKLSQPHFEWILYCYGNQLNFDYQVIICRYVWMMFEISVKKQKKFVRNNTIKLFKQLTWLAVQNAVFKIKNDVDFYDNCRLAGLTQKSTKFWRDKYSPYWKLLLQVCYELDWESLNYVDRNRKNYN